MFPGQGSQYVGMGKDLYNSFPSAKAVYDEAEEALGGGLIETVFEGKQQRLTATENAQPAILTTSIAIFTVLEKDYGFDIASSCNYCLGHSLGEYSALVATGALSLTDAVKLVRLRGQAMSQAVSPDIRTSMAALVVNGDKLYDLKHSIEKVRKELIDKDDVVELANINSSFQVVISGSTDAVAIASDYLRSQQLATRAVDLPVSAPFHTFFMNPAAQAMKEALQSIEFKDPKVEIISNVTARPITSTKEIPDLLVQQVTDTVDWYGSIKYCKENDVGDFVAIGPGKVLANLLKKEYPLDKVRSLTTAADIKRVAAEISEGR